WPPTPPPLPPRGPPPPPTSPPPRRTIPRHKIRQGANRVSGRAGNLPSRSRASARHAHHLAARCASDRGRPAPARGVQSERALLPVSCGHFVPDVPRGTLGRAHVFPRQEPFIKIKAVVSEEIAEEVSRGPALAPHTLGRGSRFRQMMRRSARHRAVTVIATTNTVRYGLKNWAACCDSKRPLLIPVLPAIGRSLPESLSSPWSSSF